MTIQLPPDLEARLKDEAQRRGVDPNECAKQVLEQGLPLRVTSPVRDQATLDLLAQWRAEDATDDPEEIARREREGEEFMRNLDRNRREMEGPNARRLWP